jgi:hypothetical protein
MTHEKLVAGTESPTRYTKIIRNPGAGTKYNRTYQEADYVSRYTKTVAGGTSYIPPAPPEPEFDPLAVADGQGSNWVGGNVYEVGQTIEGRTAAYVGGKEPVTYRYRFQFKATDSDTWVNESWTNTTNSKNSVTYTPTETGQVKLQSQARDAQDPVAQLNSVTGIKTIEPQRTIGNVTITADGTPVVFGEPIHTHVNTPVEVIATITGNSEPNYKWEVRGGYPLSVSQQAATTTLTFPEEGGPTVTLTVSDSNASDSPVTYAMNFYVASQSEWDMLHPTTN